MNQPFHPDDRPDPTENMPAMRARVPDDIGKGAFSSGVIVMTGPSEFILDFVQNLGRPHQIVSRVILPHPVMPQFIEALGTNIELYRQRFGEIQQPGIPLPPIQMAAGTDSPISDHVPHSPSGESVGVASKPAHGSDSHSPPVIAQSGGIGHSSGVGQSGGPQSPTPANGQPNLPPPRRPTAQEVYADLKLRDEQLSGTYSNAVMIGHGPHEFSFDFITNFFPQSAVSSRVFMAAGQIPRMLESLRSAWEQTRPR